MSAWRDSDAYVMASWNYILIDYRCCVDAVMNMAMAVNVWEVTIYNQLCEESGASEILHWKQYSVQSWHLTTIRSADAQSVAINLIRNFYRRNKLCTTCPSCRVRRTVSTCCCPCTSRLRFVGTPAARVSRAVERGRCCRDCRTRQCCCAYPGSPPPRSTNHWALRWLICCSEIVQSADTAWPEAAACLKQHFLLIIQLITTSKNFNGNGTKIKKNICK